MSQPYQSADYKPPRTGLLSLLPSSVVPYAELARLGKPGGFYAFVFPPMTGLALALNFPNQRTDPVAFFATAARIIPINMLLRSTACSWNDTIDADLDRQVERCRLRPVARGAITETQAHIFTACLTTLLYASVWHFEPPRELAYLTVVLLLYGIYPFCKRFTHYSQAFLGIPTAGGCWLGICAADIDPLSPKVFQPLLLLFAAEWLWTIVFDSIYAHQDVKDDIKAGAKSMAIKFQYSTRTMTLILSSVMVVLLLQAGRCLDLGLNYQIISCGGTALSLVAMIGLVDLKTPQSCMSWFTWHFWYVGGSICLGLLAECKGFQTIYV